MSPLKRDPLRGPRIIPAGLRRETHEHSVFHKFYTVQRYAIKNLTGESYLR